MTITTPHSSYFWSLKRALYPRERESRLRRPRVSSEKHGYSVQESRLNPRDHVHPLGSPPGHWRSCESWKQAASFFLPVSLARAAGAEAESQVRLAPGHSNSWGGAPVISPVTYVQGIRGSHGGLGDSLTNTPARVGCAAGPSHGRQVLLDATPPQQQSQQRPRRPRAPGSGGLDILTPPCRSGAPACCGPEPGSPLPVQLQIFVLISRAPQVQEKRKLALPEVPWVLCSPFRDKMVSGLAVVVARRSSRSGPASLLSLLPLGSFLGEPSWGAWSSHRHQGCGSPSFCITGMSTSGFTQCDRIAGSGPPRLTESLEQGSSPAFPTGHLQAMLPGPLIYG